MSNQEEKYKNILIDAMNKLHDEFEKGELAYLVSTSKPENPIRDRIAFYLHRELGENIIAREWGRIDLAILSASQIPECFVEIKLVTGGALMTWERRDIKCIGPQAIARRKWRKNPTKEKTSQASEDEKRKNSHLLVEIMDDLEQLVQYRNELQAFDGKVSKAPVFGLAFTTCSGAKFPSNPFRHKLNGVRWPSAFKHAPFQKPACFSEYSSKEYLTHLEGRADDYITNVVKSVPELNLEILCCGVIRGSGSAKGPDSLLLPKSVEPNDTPITVPWWLIRLREPPTSQ